jgi:ankyrin repeat protein
MKYLIQNGARLEARNKEGLTALAQAVQAGNIQAVRALEEAGSDFGVCDLRGNTLLHMAANGSHNSLSHTWGQGRKVTAMGYGLCQPALRWRLLRLAQSWPQTENALNLSLEQITSNFCDLITARDSPGIKFICKAFGRTRTLSAINDKCNHCGQTPLCTAAKMENMAAISLLLRFGANLDSLGCDEGPPVAAAAAWGRLEAVTLLMRRLSKASHDLDVGGPHCNLLRAGRRHDDVVKWLLVGRFVDQKKIEPSKPGGDEDESHTSIPLRHAGVGTFAYRLPQAQRRRWGESTREYAARIVSLRRGLQGRVLT